MPDLLVKLYDLPPLEPALAAQTAAGVDIVRAIGPHKSPVLRWVGQHFEQGWVDEVDVSFGRTPIGCFLALESQQIVGFACHDATCKNFFGPTGVLPSHRGRRIGHALLLACLHAMRSDGYAYAIIGGAGPVDFYRKAVGATVIDGSVPGIYAHLLPHAGGDHDAT